MDQLVKEFNAYLNDKTSFANYRNSYIKKKKSPGQIIMELNELNYAFTQKNFTDYLRNITYRKKTGYLNKTVDKSKHGGIDVMFTKFMPTKRQVDVIISCLENIYESPNIIDVLQENGYKFTPEQYEQIVNTCHNIFNLYMDTDYDKIIEQDIKNMIISILNRSTYIEDDDVTKEVDTFEDFLKNTNIQYSTTFPSWLIDTYTQNKTYYYNKNTKNTLLQILIKYNIIKTSDHSLNNNLMKENITELLDILIDNKFTPNQELMDYLIYKENHNNYALLFHEQFGFTIDIKLFHHFISCDIPFSMKTANLFVKTNSLNSLNKKTKQIKPNKKQTKESSSETIFEFFINKGIIPTAETLELACKYGDICIINYCLDKCALQPNTKHLELLLGPESTIDNDDLIPLLNKFMFYKLKLTKDHMKSLLQHPSLELVNLVVKYGYKLEYDDVGTLMTHNICIDNLENYGLKYDENLYYYSYLNNKWDYDNKFDTSIDKKILGLRKICKNPKATLQEFKDYIETEGIKPDRYCMDLACFYNGNISTHLMKNYKPTITCLYWLNDGEDVYEYKNIFLDIVNEYKIDMKYMMEPLVKKVED